MPQVTTIPRQAEGNRERDSGRVGFWLQFAFCVQTQVSLHGSKFVTQVRPDLHHFHALIPVSRSVVCSSDRVCILMRQNRFDDIGVVFTGIQNRTRGYAEAMSGDFIP